MLPVARVCVDTPLAHLDHPFDYLVPAEFDAIAAPGVRVRVRFAGRLVDGWLLDRVERSDHPGQLALLDRVVSAEPVLSPQIAVLARAVADRCAGTMSDVLRLAMPPRHARTEAEPGVPPAARPPRPEGGGWGRYPRGAAFLDALYQGRAAHACWQVLPGEDWPARLAEAAVTVAAAGRGALLVLPDHRDTERVHAAVATLAGPDAVVTLAAESGPAQRYRRWLAVRRSAVRIVVGTRAAAFAPVADLGLMVLWDDGDDLHAEPRAPYPHSRLVLGQRAVLEGGALLVAGYVRTAETQRCIDIGWTHEIVAARDVVRAAAPRVTAIGEDDTQLVRDPAARAARLPAVAFEAARAALSRDRPVLVQVPRRGYVPALACGQCRAAARCRRCAGPLALRSAGPATCRWCGTVETSYRCPTCGGSRLRATVIGARRTAEELGRAFPGVPLFTSGGGSASGREVLPDIPPGRSLVVATPGAEPLARYGAALLLDASALLARPDLRAAEEALRRWMAAAAMVEPATDGGRVVVVAESSLAAVQALVRWDPAGHARAELAARAELGFPPAARMAALDGAPATLAGLDLPHWVELLGPVPVPGQPEGERERLLVRVPRAQGSALANALAAVQAGRSARKLPDPLRIELDPLELS
ncbi:MAG: primosomal protein N' [Pseudonocardiales bacterium]|nr:primosomal protein N' [Pseudonocardiales bacterium]MBV9728942.1 primosomal protein N' [Pseudonocardiales bacterium]